MSGQPMNTEADRRLAAMLPHETFLAEEVADLDTDGVEAVIVNPPDGQFGFLPEAAVVEFNGTL